MAVEFVSVFDIFKIGVGPSSSHTLGPWKASMDFRNQLALHKVRFIGIELYGSLSKTGRGHGTDIAIMLGLSGYNPIDIDTSQIKHYLDIIEEEKCINLINGKVDYQYTTSFSFNNTSLPYHPNAMTLKAELENGQFIEQTYYSVGGGFIEKEGDLFQKESDLLSKIPYPISSEKQLIDFINRTDLPIWKLVLHNELALNPLSEIENKIDNIWQTMKECMYNGCHSEGYLPGGLHVKRRAESINKKLLQNVKYDSLEDWIACIKASPQSFDNINQWISCFALAVNEENASFGRIVTSPTNGAAGIIPAVLMYYYCFNDIQGENILYRYFFTASEIGSLFKKGATISAAAGGCQAEVGVSAAMAAAGLTELKGGSPKQVLIAAEIAMEHHLGLTCDPVGGLVQIPCIERNAIGAMKAISACNLALNTDPDSARVKLDDVIKTMWQTAQDMNQKYRETAEGGLAINISQDIIPNC
ncbi:MAG: L-serine ammonia-lyase [Saprospiraceae bacterium]|nr:L-serine ammonia-lyase [Bacteroidia bacterium]NNL90743.1 L-serine ammonia-lyase [Saprospiraceae bacterium]